MELKFNKVEKTIRYLDGVSRKLSVTRATNKKAAIQMLSWVKKNFVAEGALHENKSLKWKPLKPATIKRRIQGKGSGTPKILRDKGNLMNRWTITADNNKAVLKSQQNYSATHEYGRGKIPRRKIFPTKTQGVKIVKPVYDMFVEVSIK